ncbi:hypothetical protein ACFWFI_21375 [Streptomyces sp. NPDC060209]
MKVSDTRASAIGIRPVTRGPATQRQRTAHVANGCTATRVEAHR